MAASSQLERWASGMSPRGCRLSRRPTSPCRLMSAASRSQLPVALRARWTEVDDEVVGRKTREVQFGIDKISDRWIRIVRESNMFSRSSSLLSRDAKQIQR